MATVSRISGRMPSHLRDLAAHNYPLASLQAARDWLADYGITISYSDRRRMWCAQRVSNPGESGPDVVRAWFGVEALIVHLEHPAALVAQFRAAQKGGAV